jgi:hypothetical protein
MRDLLSRIRPASPSRQIITETMVQGSYVTVSGTRKLVPDESGVEIRITLATLLEHETLQLSPLVGELKRNWIDGEAGMPPKELLVGDDELVDVNSGMCQLAAGILACQAAAEFEYRRLASLGVTTSWAPSNWTDEQILGMMASPSLLEQLGAIADRAMGAQAEKGEADPLASACSATASTENSVTPAW